MQGKHKISLSYDDKHYLTTVNFYNDLLVEMTILRFYPTLPPPIKHKHANSTSIECRLTSRGPSHLISFPTVSEGLQRFEARWHLLRQPLPLSFLPTQSASLLAPFRGVRCEASLGLQQSMHSLLRMKWHEHDE